MPIKPSRSQLLLALMSVTIVLGGMEIAARVWLGYLA